MRLRILGLVPAVCTVLGLGCASTPRPGTGDIAFEALRQVPGVKAFGGDFSLGMMIVGKGTGRAATEVDTVIVFENTSVTVALMTYV